MSYEQLRPLLKKKVAREQNRRWKTPSSLFQITRGQQGEGVYYKLLCPYILQLSCPADPHLSP